jgi:hypothetical protein
LAAESYDLGNQGICCGREHWYFPVDYIGDRVITFPAIGHGNHSSWSAHSACGLVGSFTTVDGVKDRGDSIGKI